MNIRELNYDSYVLYQNKPSSIVAIFTYNLHCKIIGKDTLTQMLSIREIQPIPIDHHWLILLGFKQEDFKYRDKSVSEGIYRKKNIFIEPSIYIKEGFICSLRSNPSLYPVRLNYLASINYIHELQKLFNALNEEPLLII